MRAVTRNDALMVKLLLDSGSDPAWRGQNRDSMLDYAVKQLTGSASSVHCDGTVFQYLIDAGADVNASGDQILCEAVAKKNRRLSRHCLMRARI